MICCPLQINQKAKAIKLIKAINWLPLIMDNYSF
jgi:hypothetical protein